MRDVSRGPRTACYGDEDRGARDGNREPRVKDCVPRDEACGAWDEDCGTRDGNREP